MKENLEGLKFGRWSVLSFEGIDKQDKALYLCLCECGTQRVVRGTNLRYGSSQSCGCLSKDRIKQMCTTHGRSKTGTYKAWTQMRFRCLNKEHDRYKDYGGRGITYDVRWEDFNNFLEDMGECPVGMTLDRKDVNQSYSKDNCRWITNQEQQRNRRDNVMLTYKGQTKTLAEWLEEVPMKRSTVIARLSRGLSVVEAFELPVKT